MQHYAALCSTMQHYGRQLPKADQVGQVGQEAQVGSAARVEAVEKDARALVKPSDSRQP